MNKESPLYNSRLLSVYIKLLRDKYPDVSISDVLAYSAIEPYEITDEGCWFTQHQVNRFYERIVQVTENSHIAREAGRLAASPGTIGALRQHALGMLGPALAFQVINRLSKRLTRSGEYQSRSIHSNKVEIVVTPHSGVTEEHFQCENRKGFFESVVEGFHLGLPKIEHPECVFEGGSSCRYIISWKPTVSALWRLIRNTLIVTLPLTAVVGYFVLPLEIFKNSFGAVLFLTMSAALLAEITLRRQMSRSMENLWDSSEKLTELIDTNSRNVQLVNEIGQALINKKSVEDVLYTVSQVMEKGLDFDCGTILLANHDRTRLEIRGAFGYSYNEMNRLMSTGFNLDNPTSQGPFVVSYHEKKTFIVDNTKDIKETLSDRSRELINTLGVHSFLCCPIVIDNESIGIIAVTNQSTKRPLVRSDVNLLQGIAPSVGVALQNANLIGEIQESFEKTLKVLADSIDARDYLTAGHSEVVTKYAVAIAKELDLEDEYVQMIRIASLLHDYGKIAVPDAILKKDGRLTEEERDIINTHPVWTKQILSQVPFRGVQTEIPNIAGSHHERWDGEGYPEGLKGTDIPLGGRIIAVADFFEAITAKRHYREPMPLEEALGLLLESSGNHFDPAIVDVFMSYLKKQNFALEKAVAVDLLVKGQAARRRSPRVEYRTQVSIRSGKKVLSGDISSLSAKGVYIVSSDQVAVGTQIVMTFIPPGSSEYMQISGEVVWENNKNLLNSSINPGGFAVSFINLPSKVQTLVNAFLRGRLTSVHSSGKKITRVK